LAAAVVVSAPALAEPAAALRDRHPADPLEDLNRAMFAFNRAVVTRVINPTVEGLSPHVSPAVVTGLGNVYSNLTEVEFVLNNLLDGAPGPAAVSAGRFAINSTVGVLGLFDPATGLGLERRELDFIESLCKTGMPPGPYLVLPLVGPANLYSAATIASAVALEVYALSFISTTLAVADFVLIDLGGTAASLRYMNDLPPGPEGYQVQRTGHLNYVARGCGPKAVPARRAPVIDAAAPGPAPAAQPAVVTLADSPSVRFRRAEPHARPVGGLAP